VSWVFVGLLACAVVVLIAAEWPRLSRRLGLTGRRERARAKRRPNLTLVENDSDDFAASVERDLAQLPTIDEHDRSN
jgi:hypothetical protein